MKMLVAIATVAATLLLGGIAQASNWYLLSAPTDVNLWLATHDIWQTQNYSAPLSQWDVEKSFDSAAACEEGKQQHTRDMAKLTSSDSNLQMHLIMAIQKDICIASDDPRLGYR